MNSIESIGAVEPQPLLMSYQALKKALLPFCCGKKVLEKEIDDIWASATPIPNSKERIVFPAHFMQFTKSCMKENG